MLKPFSIIGMIAVPLLFLCSSNAAEVRQSKKSNSLALLIAVADCPNVRLSKKRIPSLKGPKNDVQLWRNVLETKLGFPSENIVELSSDTKSGRLPTRERIILEVERLIRDASEGDRIFIFFAGHGSQQPTQNPDDPFDPEPDGKDELILTADTGSWDTNARTVKNAIVDDEIGQWLTALNNKGCHVWFVVDACHSGTIERGGEPAVIRKIEPEELGVPNSHGDHSKTRVEPKSIGNVIVLSAAQSFEPEPEFEFPAEVAPKDRKVYGLLSWTACQILLSNPTMSYEELLKRVLHEYRVSNRTAPTPYMSGRILHLPVMSVGSDGSGPRRFHLEVTKSGDFTKSGWKIDGGILHGVTKNSILKVIHRDGSIAGYAKAVEPAALTTRVEPIAHHGQLPPVLTGERTCEMAERDYGTLKVPIGIHKTMLVKRDGLNGEQVPLTPDLKSLITDQLKHVEQKIDSYVSLSEDPEEAQWAIQVVDSTPNAIKVILVPFVRSISPGNGVQFGPVALDQDFARWILDAAQRIAKVQTLLKLSSPADYKPSNDRSFRKDALNCRLDFEVRESKDGTGSRILGPEATLKEGNYVSFGVTNNGTQSVDVVLLYLTDDFGIVSLIPSSGEFCERVAPTESLPPKTYPIQASPGPEYILLLATKTDFRQPRPTMRWLTQE